MFREVREQMRINESQVTIKINVALAKNHM